MVGGGGGRCFRRPLALSKVRSILARGVQLCKAFIHPTSECLDKRPDALLPWQWKAGSGSGHRPESSNAGCRGPTAVPDLRGGACTLGGLRDKLRAALQGRSIFG